MFACYFALVYRKKKQKRCVGSEREEGWENKKNNLTAEKSKFSAKRKKKTAGKIITKQNSIHIYIYIRVLHFISTISIVEESNI